VQSPTDVVTRYLAALEARDLPALLALLAPDAEVVEHPNRVNPGGMRYDRAALEAAYQRGSALMSAERYAVRAMIADGDRVVAQIEWTGTLRDGRTMRAELCSVVQVRDGRVWRQEQYDCFYA